MLLNTAELAAMADVTILNDVNPSAETLRRWAFDEKILLIDQDEDLILTQRTNFAVLISLADNPDCPKAAYILSSLDFYSMFLDLRGHENHFAEIRELAELARRATQPMLQAFAELPERRLRYWDGVGETTKDQALEMAKDLLLGICRHAKVSVIGESAQSWDVGLSVRPPFTTESGCRSNAQRGVLFSLNGSGTAIGKSRLERKRENLTKQSIMLSGRRYRSADCLSRRLPKRRSPCESSC